MAGLPSMPATMELWSDAIQGASTKLVEFGRASDAGADQDQLKFYGPVPSTPYSPKSWETGNGWLNVSPANGSFDFFAMHLIYRREYG